ncbi:MAG: ribosomal protein S18-alanine N-acetyltransferase [Anaerolineae bacterium]|nr:ribosomal protein S18-alanine N-acetyltransferase [Anaerolineae bacterium]
MNNRYVLRYMRPEDIQQVLEIDKLSFPLPWSARSYTFEISENKASHMIVVETAPQSSTAKGLRGVFQRLSGQTAPPVIAGYGGFWLIEGEAHVSTIAVHPPYRGQGLGEVLLSGMLGRSIDLDAEYSVLEVRVSNENAINLYKKYEYEVVGRRKNYYRDNNEDAYLMNVAPLDDAYKVRFIERLKQLHNRVPYTDVLGQDARR